MTYKVVTPKSFLQLDNFGAHLHAQGGVEIRQRFIHQKHARLADNRATQGDSLALTARQFFRPSLKHTFNTEQASGLAHAIFDFRFRNPSQPHSKSNVRIHVKMREERVVLEHHRDVAVVRQLVSYVLTIEENLTL